MKKYLAIAAVSALVISGCGKDVVEDSFESQTSSVLQVRTRAGGESEGTVSYPVNVYVFEEEVCKAVQIIGAEGQALSISLPEGDYSVFAIGGADAESYTLPTKEDATKTTPLTLNEGKSLTDLMAASSTVKLTDGGTNTLTLGLERKVMLVESVTISQVPTEATAVSLSIAPLHQALTVGTTYATATETANIVLTKQEDSRIWKSTAEQFLLPPSSQPATIAVNITTEEDTKTYSYSSNEELEAGYKINIEGTYNEAVGVELTGTITGATWKGERTISFNFDESGATGSTTEEPTSSEPSSGGNAVTGEIPTTYTSYHGCFVLSVDHHDDYAEVVLVSPYEESVGDGVNGHSSLEAINNAFNVIIARTDVDEFSDWRLPSLSELATLFEHFSDANNIFEAISNGISLDKLKNYMYETEDHVFKSHRLSQGSQSGSDTNLFGKNDVIRPFVTIHITKE